MEIRRIAKPDVEVCKFEKKKNDKFPTIIKRNSGCFYSVSPRKFEAFARRNAINEGVVSKDLPSSCLHNLLTLNVVLVH